MLFGIHSNLHILRCYDGIVAGSFSIPELASLISSMYAVLVQNVSHNLLQQ